MTIDQLLQIMPFAKSRAALFIDPLNATMDEFEINTPARQAAFLAQVAHESGQLLYVRELASGTAYEGRADLGNTQLGDGVKYKGRGLIQITGRNNYAALMMALDIDCLEHPELLESPINACRSAGWFWGTHKLNQLADIPDFLTITKRINGGTNGLADRQAFYATAKQVLGVGNG
jgi:putative chitinase